MYNGTDYYGHRWVRIEVQVSRFWERRGDVACRQCQDSCCRWNQPCQPNRYGWSWPAGRPPLRNRRCVGMPSEHNHLRILHSFIQSPYYLGILLSSVESVYLHASQLRCTISQLQVYKILLSTKLLGSMTRQCCITTSNNEWLMNKAEPKNKKVRHSFSHQLIRSVVKLKSFFQSN